MLGFVRPEGLLGPIPDPFVSIWAICRRLCSFEDGKFSGGEPKREQWHGNPLEPNPEVHRERIGYYECTSSAHRVLRRYLTQGRSRVQCPSVLPVEERSVPFVRKAGVRYLLGVANNKT